MRLRRVLTPALPALLAVFLLAGCGDDDGSSTPPPGGASATTAASGAATEDDAGADAAASDADDPSNPWVLGYRVTGPAGSVVEVEVIAIAAGDEQPSFTQRPNLDDDPWIAVFTNWVESATLEVTVTSGGPVTVEGITGRFQDPEDPFGGIDVSEVHGSVELDPGASGTLQVP